MKVKITENELTNIISEILNESVTCDCPERLNEELTKTDEKTVQSLVKKEIRDFIGATANQNFETVVTKMVKDKISGDKQVEKHLVEISRNVLIQLYKSLWVKRHFWSNSLSNNAN